MSILAQSATIELSTDLQGVIVEAISFLDLDRSLRDGHAWMNRCHVHRNVSKYLRSKPGLHSRFSAIQLATITAQTYRECGDITADSFAYPSAVEAKNIKSRADGLANLVVTCRWLPDEAKTPEFHKGLDVLRNVHPCKRIKGENKKGDPRRRAFIVRLAENFYRSFRDISIAAITDLTSLGWPDITDRSVRLVLTSKKQSAIAAQVNAAMESENSANTETFSIIKKMTRRGLFDTVEVRRQKQQQAKDDDALLRMAITHLEKLNDKEIARAAIAALNNVAVEFDLRVTDSTEVSGSEIVDF